MAPTPGGAVHPPRPRLAHIDELRGQVRSIADDLFATLQREVPIYAAIPEDQLDADFRPNARRIIKLVLDCITEDRFPTARELVPATELAACRAEEGFDLGSLLEACSIGFHIITLHYLARDDGSNSAEFLTRGQRVFRTLQHTTTSAFIECVRSDLHGNGSENRQLIERLLRPSMTAGDRLDLAATFAPLVDVLVLRLGHHPHETLPTKFGQIAAARKIRRVFSAALAIHPNALASLSDEGGTVLLPAEWHIDLDVEGFVAAMAAATEVRVVAAHERCDVTDVAAAVVRLRDVLFLGDELRRG
ncbi:MAG: hypothetical protein GX868_06040, partial [Actinobacteria bacterium]|nr:hypothetical protein [Actinomycetota bacterium]